MPIDLPECLLFSSYYFYTIKEIFPGRSVLIFLAPDC